MARRQGALIAIGIDEDTAIVVRNKTFTVIGSRSVTILDLHDLTHNDLPYRRKGESLTLINITMHVLAKGARYDLVGRKPVLGSRRHGAA